MSVAEEGIADGGARHGLVDALVAVSSDLDLASVLDRLVRAACELTGARYGALGVLAPDGHGLSRFVTHGVTDAERAAIGPVPQGHGILGLLIQEPEPLRLSRLQDHPASVGFPPRHPPMTGFLGVPVRVRGTVFGNLYLCDKAGGAEFTAADQELVIALAAGAAHVIENARAYVRSERRRVWLEAVVGIGELLRNTTDASQVAGQIAISARRLGGADATAVVRVGEAGEGSSPEVEVLAVDGPRAELLATLLPRLGTRLARAVGRQGEVQVGEEGADRLLMVPLREHLGERRGLVLLAEVMLDAGETELLVSFADQIALALDRLHAEEQRDQMRLVADRERIARDLHDVVIQRLFATGLQLQNVQRRSEDPETHQRIQRAVDALDSTIRDIRGTIFELRHAHEQTVRGMVLTVLEEYAETLGHRPRLSTSGPVETVVDEALGADLAAVLREALSNVARHACASRTTVELNVADGWLRLVVADDGVGLPEGRVESGLSNIRVRAGHRGGLAEVTAPDSGGTRVRWEVPLD